VSDIDEASVQALLARWWFHYDQGDFDRLDALLTDDTRFTCRTDTGTTDFEEFVRADVSGHDDVLRWQVEHRRGSPFPLRHNATNVHIDGREAGGVTFASYLFVTHVLDGQPANLSSAIVRGTVRRDGDELRLAALDVTLDTMTSTTFGDR
jgi:hypothetical protein